MKTDDVLEGRLAEARAENDRLRERIRELQALNECLEQETGKRATLAQFIANCNRAAVLVVVRANGDRGQEARIARHIIGALAGVTLQVLAEGEEETKA